MKYSNRWIAGVNERDRRIIEEMLSVDNKILDRLNEICYNMVKSSETGDTDFENPNWAFKQAHWLGYRKAVRDIMTLCKNKDDKSN
jgi:hypothetical protein